MKLNEINTGKSVADLGKKYKGGNFNVGEKNLTSLEGAPQKVGGSFHCAVNKLTSLEGAPLEVGGSFDCNSNNLASLRGAPQKVGGNFYCSHNDLTTLEGAPQKVGRHFWCGANNLTSLEGAPQEVGGHFDCSRNKLTSLVGAPQEVGGDFLCHDNKLLTSLKDIHRYIHRINREFNAHDCEIQSHVLGLLLIKDLKKVKLDNKEVEAIINSHLDGGSMKSALDCQHALIKAGYPEFAKL